MRAFLDRRVLPKILKKSAAILLVIVRIGAKEAPPVVVTGVGQRRINASSFVNESQRPRAGASAIPSPYRLHAADCPEPDVALPSMPLRATSNRTADVCIVQRHIFQMPSEASREIAEME